jgi:hypothetical protein
MIPGHVVEEQMIRKFSTRIRSVFMPMGALAWIPTLVLGVNSTPPPA